MWIPGLSRSPLGNGAKECCPKRPPKCPLSPGNGQMVKSRAVPLSQSHHLRCVKTFKQAVCSATMNTLGIPDTKRGGRQGRQQTWSDNNILRKNIWMVPAQSTPKGSQRILLPRFVHVQKGCSSLLTGLSDHWVWFLADI